MNIPAGDSPSILEKRSITLGHGSGGRLTHSLVKELFVKHFSNSALVPLGDSALLDRPNGRLAFTTDAFVVKPLFFPGGNIGAIGVNGTVNDLAVAGAKPLYLSAAFVIEEGFGWAELEKIAESMASAAKRAGVSIVTGDTKVVERGHGDGVYLTTAGVGQLREEAPPGACAVKKGDAVIVSGPVGDHGAVIGALRSGMELDGLESDCGPVNGLVDAIYLAGARPRFMRDPTRGGLATVLAELAEDSNKSIRIFESKLPIRDSTRAICDLLGLDPLYLACEGRMVAVVPADQAEQAKVAMRREIGGEQAEIIGEVVDAAAAPVILVTRYGGSRLYDTLASEQLPRIC